MNFTYRLLIAFLGVIFFGNVYVIGQIDVNVESHYLMSSKDNLQPHYQYSNKWGIVSPFEQSQGMILGGIKTKLFDLKTIQLETGVTGVLKNKTDESFLHEAYLNGKFFSFLNISIGKHAFSPVSCNDELTVGGFMRNNNARPIPRVQVGIFEYVPVIFLNDMVEVKGGLSHGLLNDDRTSSGKVNSADDIQVHEKWAYVRLGGDKKIKPYAGLFHAALMGGTRANGTKIPIDYWATFFGKGSSKIGGGEETNAAGGHDGFWDLGFYYNHEKGKIQFYIQKPFADKTGLRLWQFRNKDYKVGFLAELSGFKFIKNISAEVFRTDVQAGKGLPDPIYPKGHPDEGQILFINSIDDYDAFMLETFGETTDGYDRYDVEDYLVKNMNDGWQYGERDDYNNNGTYYNGWTYDGQPMGLPLYHTYYIAMSYAPDWNANNHVIFMNNRVKGFHIGFSGDLTKELNYQLKSTYTNNLGSYGEEYIRRYSWEEDPEFYYAGGKKEVYTYLSFQYKPELIRNLSFNSALSFDFGELYHSFGFSFGIRYEPTF